MELPIGGGYGWGGAREGAGRKPQDGRGGARQGAGRPLGRKTRPDRRKLEPPGESKMPTPKVADYRPIALRARDWTHLALATLVIVMRDVTAPAASRVTAATAMLDRAYGKPTDRIENISDPNALDRMSDEQIELLVAALRTDAAARGTVIEIKAEATADAVDGAAGTPF